MQTLPRTCGVTKIEKQFLLYYLFITFYKLNDRDLRKCEHSRVNKMNIFTEMLNIVERGGYKRDINHA